MTLQNIKKFNQQLSIEYARHLNLYRSIKQFYYQVLLHPMNVSGRLWMLCSSSLITLAWERICECRTIIICHVTSSQSSWGLWVNLWVLFRYWVVSWGECISWCMISVGCTCQGISSRTMRENTTNRSWMSVRIRAECTNRKRLLPAGRTTVSPFPVLRLNKRRWGIHWCVAQSVAWVDQTRINSVFTWLHFQFRTRRWVATFCVL